MIHQKIKDLFQSSVEHICSDISDYSVHPDIDFQRNRKLSAQKLISFLVSQGSSSTKVEMLDFWGLDDSSLPTSSALNQQRQKLKPDAMEAVVRYARNIIDSNCVLCVCYLHLRKAALLIFRALNLIRSSTLYPTRQAASWK